MSRDWAGLASSTSLRPFTETVRDGFFSWPETLTLDNYRAAWAQGPPSQPADEIMHLCPFGPEAGDDRRTVQGRQLTHRA